MWKAVFKTFFAPSINWYLPLPIFIKGLFYFMDIFIGALIFTSIMLAANTLALMNMTMQTNKTREILEKISKSLSKTNNNGTR